MRTLVLGAKGQLGRDLMQRLSYEGETVGFDLPELDITNPEHVADAIHEMHPDAIVNAAAFTDVEAAEDQEEAAFAINEVGAGRVADTADLLNVPVVYYSTDFVFAGDSASPYEPDDACGPLSVYGRSKAAGERATRAANQRHFVIRTAWLYGPGGNNFVEKILRLAQTTPALTVVDDEVGSPTHTADLAEATAALLNTHSYGTYHAVNDGSCGRREFAQAILETAGIALPVQGCSSAQFPMKAQRPRYSVLSNDKLQQVTGCVMPHWRDALKLYMQRRQG